MKLGVSYNLFNGNELLEESLKRIREVADFIVLVYSDYSHAGIYDNSAYIAIQNLDKKLYDKVVCFEPLKSNTPEENELAKRNTGLKYSKKARCSHFMSIDCDEFYDIENFKKAKARVEAEKADGSYCELVNYFWNSKYQMVESNTQYVPFIYKIRHFRKHRLKYRFPVIIDPTRIIPSKKVLGFKSEELLMHHMSYVRLDEASLRCKLIHSPNIKLFEDVLDDYISYFKNWTPDQAPLNPHQFKANAKSSTSIKEVTPVIKLNVEFNNY